MTDEIEGDEPFEDDGADYDSSPPPRLGGGCFFCNHPGGECMSPGDHCPLAKKMFAPKPRIEAVAGPELFVPTGSGTIVPNDQGGVWVTFDDQIECYPTELTVWATEIEALRHGMAKRHVAQFLAFGEELSS